MNNRPKMQPPTFSAYLAIFAVPVYMLLTTCGTVYLGYRYIQSEAELSRLRNVIHTHAQREYACVQELDTLYCRLPIASAVVSQK